MQGRLPLIALLLILAPLPGRASQVSASPLSTVAPLVVPPPGKGIAELGGPWQFRTGDDMAWSSPAFNDSAWESIAVDRPWGAQTHFAYTGFAWYRRHIDFIPGSGTPQELTLLMPTVSDAYEVYWNGMLIGHYGKLPPHPVWYSPVPHTFGLGKPHSGVMAIRVWSSFSTSTSTGESGGLTDPPLVGSSAAITATKVGSDYEDLRNNQYSYGLALLSAAFAFLGLLAWLRDRTQRLILWTVLFLLSGPLYTFLFGLTRLVPINVMDLLLVVLIFVWFVPLWFLLFYLFQLEDRPVLYRWIRIAAIVATASIVLDGLVGLSYPWLIDHTLALQIADAVTTAPLIFLSFFILIAILRNAGKRMLAANRMVAIFALLSATLTAATGAASQGQRFTHWTLASRLSMPLLTFDGNRFNAERILSTLLLLSIVYAVYRHFVDQTERQGTLEQEFKSAQELQRILIPETLPPIEGYAVTSAYRPAQEVGGDFFQLIALPDGAALLVLGDVSGKGLKAAMTVSLLVGALRTLAETSSDPAQILAGLNRRLEGRVHNGFATCLVLRLEADGACIIANAGHLSPFMNEAEVPLPPALPLGIVPDTDLELVFLHLGIGDRLTLYTDGLLEARSRSGELYGFDRVCRLIATHPDAPTASEAAVAFGQDDDITVLTITRLAVGVESTTLLAAPQLVSATS